MTAKIMSFTLYTQEQWDLERPLLLERSGSERSGKLLVGVSWEVRGIPIGQYSEQSCTDFNTKTSATISDSAECN